MPTFEIVRRESVTVEAEDSDQAVHKAFHDIDQGRWSPADGSLRGIEEVETVQGED